MRVLGNILWFILVGFVLGICWIFTGMLWCITIVGIPVGIQCFKFAGLVFCPFGRDVVHTGSVGSTILNILWIVFGGLALSLSFATIGVVLCVTIIGIPFGIQCLKFAKLSLIPFGAEIIPVN